MLKRTYPKPSTKRCPKCGKPLIRDRDEIRCHGRCDFGPRDPDDVVGAKVWQTQPDNDHTWAFIYYLARRDCDVRLRHSEDTITIVLDEHKQATDSKEFRTFEP
jgi:hypothetical protein